MIVSHLVNLSLLLGAVLSYGIMWPLINKLKGDWFPENLGSEADMKGLYGYKVYLFLVKLTSVHTSLELVINLLFSCCLCHINLAGFHISCSDPWRWALQFPQDNELYHHEYPWQIKEQQP